MVKFTNKSIQMDMSNWLVISFFLIVLTFAGTASSMAGPDLTAVTTGVIKKKEDKLANLDEAEDEYLK